MAFGKKWKEALPSPFHLTQHACCSCIVMLHCNDKYCNNTMKFIVSPLMRINSSRWKNTTIFFLNRQFSDCSKQNIAHSYQSAVLIILIFYPTQSVELRINCDFHYNYKVCSYYILRMTFNHRATPQPNRSITFNTAM